tara:strand:+ start:58 stop:1734 length:1677 start_codon:yes stop_codon:yes gene_type:complete
MCIGFDHARTEAEVKKMNIDAAVTHANASFMNAHANTSCDGTQIGIFINPETTEVLLANRLAIKSLTNVFCCMPIRVDLCGENGERMVPSNPIPCCHPELIAYGDPGSFLPIPEKLDLPSFVFRSAGDCDDTGHQAVVDVLDIPLPAGRIVSNADGSKHFLLRIGHLVLDAKGISDAIAAGRFEDASVYRHRMGRACINALLLAMRENGVDPSLVFDMNEDGDDVSGEAICCFMDGLLPSLVAHSHLIVCVPPFDEEGSPQMDSAFDVVLKYPPGTDVVALLSAVHNMDPEDPEGLQWQHSDVFITSNMYITMEISGESAPGSCHEVKLLPSSAYLPDVDKAIAEAEAAAMEHYRYRHQAGPCFRSLQVEPEIDYDAWTEGCKVFQELRRADYWAKLGPFLAAYGFPEMIDCPLYCTNIKGMLLPEHSVAAKLHIDRGTETASCKRTSAFARLPSGGPPRAASPEVVVQGEPLQPKQPPAPPALALPASLATAVVLKAMINGSSPRVVEFVAEFMAEMNSGLIENANAGMDKFRFERMTESQLEDVVKFTSQHLARVG